MSILLISTEKKPMLKKGLKQVFKKGKASSYHPIPNAIYMKKKCLFCRELESSPSDTEKLMFPNITRKEADKDLIHCIKYLANYGFYKFGVEVRTSIYLMAILKCDTQFS